MQNVDQITNNKYHRWTTGYMALYLIGLGLGDEKDVTLRGLEIIKRCGRVWLEAYTSVLGCTKEQLEQLYGRTMELADRNLVEKQGDSMVEMAASEDVALLVVGDPMSATTHLDLVLRARKKGVAVDIVHNASVMTAVGVVGLELYKYGKTTSIVFPDEKMPVETHYDAVKENLTRGLHTLCLLDIKIGEKEPRFMTIKEGVASLLSVEKKRGENVFTDDTLCVGCARLGGADLHIKAGKASELLSEDFGGPLHCLIVPGRLHFMEEEALEQWK